MWNYRVMRTTSNGEESYGVHEVYYDEAGRPQYYSENPVPCYSETLEGLREELVRFEAALQKEVLTKEDFVSILRDRS